MTQESKGTRKTRTGTVVSNKMQNTIVVSVETTMPHPRYGKVITRAKKYYAHTEAGGFQIGDKVEITETRPLSKLKRWRVTEKFEAASNK